MAFPFQGMGGGVNGIAGVAIFASRSFDLTERNVIMNKPD